MCVSFKMERLVSVSFIWDGETGVCVYFIKDEESGQCVFCLSVFDQPQMTVTEWADGCSSDVG